MSLVVKGGSDGLAIFETDEGGMKALAKRLIMGSICFYSEPWPDGLYHVTVNGSAGPVTAELLKANGWPCRKVY